MTSLSESILIEKYKMHQVDGVVVYPNCFYMPVRVTGTGTTLRYEDGRGFFLEDRLKSAFFTKDNIEKCGRLPITLEHPSNDILNSDTIKNAIIVGQTISAWIEGDEIWGLARIYDKSLLDKLGKGLNSTSPGVVSYVENDVEKPIEINHLAFVQNGHWDQLNNKAFRLDEEDKMVEKITPSTQITSDNASQVKELKEDVQDLKEHEKSEAPILEELANTHKTIEGDSMLEEVKNKKDDEIEEVKEIEDSDEILEVSDDEVEEIEDNVNADIVALEEIKDSEDDEKNLDDEEEIIIDDEETKLDSERIEVLQRLRMICDCAHPSLKIKMPYIKDRETGRSVISKFAKLNTHLVDSKYKPLLQNARLDAMSFELARDIVNSIETLVNFKNEQLGSKADKLDRGFVDTGRGYLVDKSF